MKDLIKVLIHIFFLNINLQGAHITIGFISLKVSVYKCVVLSLCYSGIYTRCKTVQ